jgi:signal transduction histidine kinase
MPVQRDESAHAAELGAAHVRLEDLVAELQERAGIIQTAADRLRLLLETVLAVGSGLSLPSVLHTIVSGACRLVDARYGALGVIGSDRRLTEFVTVGIDDDTRARIGNEPEGHGILGLLVADPQPLRLADLSTHPDSYGFPPNHPPMRSFLGVPIRVRDDAFGNLYLCEKQGAHEFTESDQKLVSALAVAAGVAIENADLYAQERRREQWLHAIAAINQSLLMGTPIDEVLDEITVHVRSLSRVNLVRLMLPNEDGSLRIVAAEGDNAEAIRGTSIPMEGTAAGDAFASGETQLIGDASADARIHAPGIAALQPGSVAYMPLATHEETLGVLSIANAKDGPDFDSADFRMVDDFARQAALAIELARTRADRDRLRVFEDRERIARELHDTVIQRLFAAGITLQALASESSTAREAARLEQVTSEIDYTIHEIRTSIFALEAHNHAGTRAVILSLAHDAADRAAFVPRVRFTGPVDQGTPSEVVPHLLACAREALSNVARHAQATEVDVDVAVSDAVVLRITDNGVGFGPGESRRSGLANLARRAEILGGTFRIESQRGGGTTVIWQVPALAAQPERTGG